MKLFGAGVCEICGRSGRHSECEERARRRHDETLVADATMLRRHARFGDYGVHSADSARSLEVARLQLEDYLGRATSFDPARCVEGESWWFLPESWIGMIGFIVEKPTGAIFPLGSGIVGLYGHESRMSASCIAICWYLDGHAARDRVA